MELFASGQRETQAKPGFDLAQVNAALERTIFHGKLHHFSQIDSTQARAIADAQAGIASGQVYLADAQTAGRGRGGHTWHSEPDRGLYLTVLVRPALHAEAALRLSFAAGLAAQSAIAQVCGFRIDLRWPNDLVTPGPNSRKLGGILTETAMLPDGQLRYAAIGIGINLNQAKMPADLEVISTSLLLETGERTPREALAAALLQALDQELRAIADADPKILQRLEAGSTWVRGKRVCVNEDDGYTGVTEGLTEAGLLRVRCADGSLRTVRHGGVREAGEADLRSHS